MKRCPAISCLAFVVAIGGGASGQEDTKRQEPEGVARPAESMATAGQRATKSDLEDFEAMMERLVVAQSEFHNGRPEAIKSLWSHTDDVTVAGGAGGPIEKGWEQISRRLDWASAQFSSGTQSNDRLVTTVSGDFAYVVQIEHIRFRVPGQARESTRDYRVTIVFRREAGEWRIVHRQADTQMTREVPK